MDQNGTLVSNPTMELVIQNPWHPIFNPFLEVVVPWEKSVVRRRMSRGAEHSLAADLCSHAFGSLSCLG